MFEVKTEQIDKVMPEIKRIMEAAIELKVPLIVDMGTGSNWDQAH